MGCKEYESLGGVDMGSGDNQIPKQVQQSILGMMLQGGEMSPEKEMDFQKWIKGLPFYDEFKKKYGEGPNLNSPDYDYRKAHEAGVYPSRNRYDQRYHWGSDTPGGEPLKAPWHSTGWMNDYQGSTGQDPQASELIRMLLLSSQLNR